MPKGTWRKHGTAEGAEYIASWTSTYKERMRPKIEEEIQHLRSKLEQRERDYREIYGEQPKISCSNSQ